MSTQMQLRGGTTAENLLFTGAQREVTVDTDKNTLVVQDGVTAGGFPLATEQALSDGTFYFNDDTAGGSAADAYILTPKANTNTPTQYLDGIQLGFTTNNANTGPSTATFSGLGVRSLKYAGGIDPAPGDISGRVYLIYDLANGWFEIQRKAQPPIQPKQIQTLTATVSASALTVGLAATTLDFRAAPLTSGSVTTITTTAATSIVAPNGASLGTTNAIQSRIAVLAINASGVIELALVNIAGGTNLDETTLISTSAISGASTSANVIYSTVARANVPFRVVGYVESTQPIAGAWSAAPSTIQGQGGLALASISTLGAGQTWQDVTGSRVAATNYTNTTGKPIFISVYINDGGTPSTITIGGVVAATTDASGSGSFISMSAIVPPGAVYIVAGTIIAWRELR